VRLAVISPVREIIVLKSSASKIIPNGRYWRKAVIRDEGLFLPMAGSHSNFAAGGKERRFA
jgi:hypothetical protein